MVLSGQARNTGLERVIPGAWASDVTTPPSSGSVVKGLGVDDVAVADLGGRDLVVGLGDVLTTDHLHHRVDAVLGAEVQHLLGLSDPADVGTRQDLVAAHQGAEADAGRLLGQADVHEDAVGLEPRI